MINHSSFTSGSCSRFLKKYYNKKPLNNYAALFTQRFFLLSSLNSAAWFCNVITKFTIEDKKNIIRTRWENFLFSTQFLQNRSFCTSRRKDDWFPTEFRSFFGKKSNAVFEKLLKKIGNLLLSSVINQKTSTSHQYFKFLFYPFIRRYYL